MATKTSTKSRKAARAASTRKGGSRNQISRAQPAARSQSRKTATPKTPRQSVVIATQPEPKPSKLPMVDIDPTKLHAGADLSMIITDFDELRDRAIKAMGDFAKEAKGSDALLAHIEASRTGPGRRIMAHPLDVMVVPGMVNSRDFTTTPMKLRVRDMAYDVRKNGVREPLKVFPHDGKVVAYAGETRMRATFMAWIMFGEGPRRVPAVQESGLNDIERLIAAMRDQDTMDWTPIDTGRHIIKIMNLGATVEEIAEKLNKTGDGSATDRGAGIAWVKRHIGFMEMPNQVLRMVSEQNLSATTARQWFDKLGQNSQLMVQLASKAVQIQQQANASHVMPKHLRLAEQVLAAEGVQIGGKTGGKTSRANDDAPDTDSQTKSRDEATESGASDHGAVATPPTGGATAGNDALTGRILDRMDRTSAILREVSWQVVDGKVVGSFSSEAFAELAATHHIPLPEGLSPEDDASSGGRMTGSDTESGEGVSAAMRSSPHGEASAVHAD